MIFKLFMLNFTTKTNIFLNAAVAVCTRMSMACLDAQSIINIQYVFIRRCPLAPPQFRSAYILKNKSRQKDQATTRVNLGCYIDNDALYRCQYYRHGFGAKRRVAQSLGLVAVKKNTVLWYFSLQIRDRPMLLIFSCFCF